MKHYLRLFVTLLVSTTLSVNVFSQLVISTVVSDVWGNNTWQPALNSVYTYDAQCKLTTVTLQKWQIGSGIYVDTFRTTFTYDVNGKASQTTFQTWNTTTSVWDNNLRMTYTYNADNTENTVLNELWQNNAWNNATLTTDSYNADKTVSQKLTQAWKNNKWKDLFRQTYTYNADKTVRQDVTDLWAVVTWLPQSRNGYSYNAQAKVLTDTSQTWNGSTWLNSTLTINTYNGSGNLTNALRQNWNGSAWINSSQTNNTYNGDGNLAESISQDWQTAGSTWLNTDRDTYNYADCATMPITLFDFTASPNGKAIQLKWTTVTEINGKDFNVQRSRDGVVFENIGTVNAAGNSTNKINYQFTDAGAIHAGISKVYYRLRMNDNDGKYAFSKTVSVNIIPLDKLVSAYPNPVKDYLNLTFNIAASNISVKIIDQNGRAVYQQQLSNMQSGSVQKINTASLNKGIYYVQWNSGTDVQSIKIVKY